MVEKSESFSEVLSSGNWWAILIINTAESCMCFPAFLRFGWDWMLWENQYFILENRKHKMLPSKLFQASLLLVTSFWVWVKFQTVLIWYNSFHSFLTWVVSILYVIGRILSACRVLAAVWLNLYFKYAIISKRFSTSNFFKSKISLLIFVYSAVLSRTSLCTKIQPPESWAPSSRWVSKKALWFKSRIFLQGSN